MVLLTMTSTIVEALKVIHDPNNSYALPHDTIARNLEFDEPCIENPTIGKPISHGQILDTWKTLKASGHTEFKLEDMLRGATIYVPPPPPKPEPVRLSDTNYCSSAQTVVNLLGTRPKSTKR